MSDNPYAAYLHDVTDVLIREARRAAAEAPDPPGEWDNGYVLGLVCALDWMKQQAVAFGLPMEDLGPLAEVDPERELLLRKPPVD
jgi:hypothetical protein